MTKIPKIKNGKEMWLTLFALFLIIAGLTIVLFSLFFPVHVKVKNQQNQNKTEFKIICKSNSNKEIICNIEPVGDKNETSRNM